VKAEQAYLYLLCYAWQRYQQLNDNLVEAFCHHTKHYEEETKQRAAKLFLQHQTKLKDETPRVGRLLLLYVDDSLNDRMPFGEVRQRAFVRSNRTKV
jgi:hypothetical protein